jgi:hypothetical protein
MSDVAQGFILRFHPNMFFVRSLDCFRVQSNCNEKREYREEVAADEGNAGRKGRNVYVICGAVPAVTSIAA